MIGVKRMRHPFSMRGQADRCRQVALAATGRAEQEQIGALAQPVAGRGANRTMARVAIGCGHSQVPP